MLLDNAHILEGIMSTPKCIASLNLIPWPDDITDDARLYCSVSMSSHSVAFESWPDVVVRPRS